MKTPGMKYRRVEVSDGNALIDWAEENGVEWDVWNPEEFLTDDSALMELGLEEWPKCSYSEGETPPEWHDPEFEKELEELETQLLMSN